MKELVCARPGCDQTFTPIKPNHIYCTVECQHQQSRLRGGACTEAGCDAPALSRDLCQHHYDQRRRSGDLPPLRFDRECVVCGAPFTTKAYQRITCTKECLKERREQTKAERMRTRGCARCGERFEVSSRGGGSYCPDCQRDWAREWREANPERAKEAGRRQNLWVKYRMTLEDYDAMLAAQDGVCAICGRAGDKKALAVDHDHRCCPGDRSCGQCIRGLLCTNCNNGIGRFQDDAKRLRVAASYLEAAGQPQPALFLVAA